MLIGTSRATRAREGKEWCPSWARQEKVSFHWPVSNLFLFPFFLFFPFFGSLTWKNYIFMFLFFFSIIYEDSKKKWDKIFWLKSQTQLLEKDVPFLSSFAFELHKLVAKTWVLCSLKDFNCEAWKRKGSWRLFDSTGSKWPTSWKSGWAANDCIFGEVQRAWKKTRDKNHCWTSFSFSCLFFFFFPCISLGLANTSFDQRLALFFHSID